MTFILWIGPNGAQYVMPYNYVSVWNDQYNQAMLAQQQCENISALISPKAITNCDDGSPTNSSGERFLSKGVKSRKGKQGFRLTKQPKAITRPVDPSDGEQDSEYGSRSLPPRQITRRKSSSQNQNRNIIPNIVQQIFSYLAKGTKSRKFCEKLFATLEAPKTVIPCSIQRFYSFQKMIKDNMNHYVNQQSLATFRKPIAQHFEIYPKEEQEYYMKLTRIMISDFLTRISPLLTIQSKRMCKSKRCEHLRLRRVLHEKLLEKTITD